MPLYLNQEGSSNKFWSYKIKGDTITYKWGRVGTDGEVLLEAYSPSKLAKKIASKLKKGYVEVDDKKLEKEKNLAEGLGFRAKINDIKFVSVKFGKTEGYNQALKTSELSEYNPDESILVNLLDSWSKDNRWVLLSTKNGNKELTPGGKKNEWLTSTYSGADTKTCDAIMGYLDDMITKFTTIVTASFGSLGGRALDDSSYQSAVNKFKNETKADISDAVINKIAKIAKVGFANMGARALDI